MRRNAAPPTGAGSGWITIPIDPEGALPDVLAEPFSARPDEARDWLTGLTHLARPGGLGDFRVLVQARGIDAGRAASAISWLNDGDAADGYTLAELAAMIPAEALALGPERFRLGG